MPDRIAFVTGGSGFLGRRLIETLRQRGFAVRALARSEAAVAAVTRAGADPVRGDLDQDDALRAGMRGAALCVHAAALAEEWGDPAAFHQANVIGTERVLAAARAAALPRLVHVSTEAVLLGGRPIVNADETWPIPERPIGLYAASKAQAEHRVRATAADGLCAMIIRPRLIWGRGDTSVLPRLVAAVRSGQFAWIGGGAHLTSSCHVDNVCEGALRCAENGRPGEVYFLTDGPPLPMRDFLTPILKTQGVDPGARSLPRPVAYTAAALLEWTARTLGVPKVPPVTRMGARLIGEEVTVNDAKARRELGYASPRDRESALKEMSAPA